MLGISLGMAFSRYLLHELASFECCDVCSIEFKPFAVLPFGLKTLMPIRLDAAWIVRSDDVDTCGFFGKLNCEFVFFIALRAPIPDQLCNGTALTRTD